MDDSTATKLYASLKLRAMEYRERAAEFRSRADDVTNAEAREKYLRLARGLGALAEKAEHLIEEQLTGQTPTPLLPTARRCSSTTAGAAARNGGPSRRASS